jgi:hypothetical protein
VPLDEHWVLGNLDSAGGETRCLAVLLPLLLCIECLNISFHLSIVRVYLCSSALPLLERAHLSINIVIVALGICIPSKLATL